jgi:hypothetical protein
MRENRKRSKKCVDFFEGSMWGEAHSEAGKGLVRGFGIRLGTKSHGLSHSFQL